MSSPREYFALQLIGCWIVVNTQNTRQVFPHSCIPGRTCNRFAMTTVADQAGSAVSIVGHRETLEETS